MNNVLEVGSLCKHFKGKNIYKIISLNNNGKNLDPSIEYTGTKDYLKLTNLVIYMNIFNNRFFAREYDDFYVELSKEEQEEYGQVHRVEPLSEEEIQNIERN